MKHSHCSCDWLLKNYNLLQKQDPFILHVVHAATIKSMELQYIQAFVIFLIDSKYLHNVIKNIEIKKEIGIAIKS